ncbi:unnamed protein product [Staurois parvus]|uniref:Uncharacterized protein n=1 Tax=Staurois parvus TaxID=386267 RepID=A0ABN9CUV1_9NEOB|nr:unnamed protein product [Staurois parvus]
MIPYCPGPHELSVRPRTGLIFIFSAISLPLNSLSRVFIQQ